MPVLRTDNTRAALSWQQTILTGGPIAVGDTFRAIHFPDAPPIRSDIAVIRYDDDLVCVASADAQTFYFLSGDIAAVGNSIYSQQLDTTVHFDHPLPALVGHAPREEWYSILHQRFYRIPPRLLRLIVGL